MSDIFISYASGDRQKAQMIWWSLRDRGFSVWWDREILAGERFDRAIDDALDEAKCVLVLWSRRSVGSDWVQEEATRGRSRGVLIPVRIDDVDIPLGFSRLQSADLADWQGESDHPELQRILSSIERLLGPGCKRGDSRPLVPQPPPAPDPELEPQVFAPPPARRGQTLTVALWTAALLLSGFTAADVVKSYESPHLGPSMLEDAWAWVKESLTTPEADDAGTVFIAPSHAPEPPAFKASVEHKPAGRPDRRAVPPKTRPEALRAAGMG